MDYFETFSLVGKITTMRVLMAFSSNKNRHLEQLGVNKDFLNGDLNEELYMDFAHGHPVYNFN